MTNEEAIEVLNNWDMACPICEKRKSEEKGVCADCRFNNALNFAIKSLEERLQGEWITRHKLNSFGQDVVCFECNKCGEYKVPLYHLLITEPLKVCPNCGADMRKGGAE